jgi:hypothetical protein
MKTILTVFALLLITTISFGQKTFSSKQEAIEWLEETFKQSFVKAEIPLKTENVT